MNAKVIVPLVLMATFMGFAPAHAYDDSVDTRELNRVVVVIDRTRSFEKYFAPAAKNVRNYLASMSTMASGDQVYLVAMGATPELKGYFPGSFFTSGQKQVLEESLGACQDDIGTDVTGAISMAIDILNQPPIVGGKHLLIFSDGNVDDAKNGSTVTRHFRHLGEFDWGALRGIHTEWYYLGQEPSDVKSLMLKIPAVYSAVSRKDMYLWNQAESETAQPNCPPPSPAPVRDSQPVNLKSLFVYGGIAVVVAYLLKGRNQPNPRRRRNLQRRAN